MRTGDEMIGGGVDDVNYSPESVWVSQAEAARLRGVSRQAISKLVEKDRFRTHTIGDRTFVHREDVGHGAAAKPAASAEAAELIGAIELLSDEAQEEVFRWMLARHRVHSLEVELGADAEVILEAISRSAPISKRGVRGLLAEAFFKIHVLDGDDALSDRTPAGEHAFDFLVHRTGRDYRIQVKLARQRAGNLMPPTKKVLAGLPPGEYAVAETQRTRGGKRSDGKDTRPYRFGEFDLLAVSIHPATGDWSDFRYSRTPLLLARENQPELLRKMQPVALEPFEGWHGNIHDCLDELDAARREASQS
ncbi:MAG: hypothetical protein AAF907_09635 [Planctomycetota bacterium]